MSQENTSNCHEASPAQGHEVSPAQGHEASLAQGHEASPARGHEASPGQGHEASPGQGHEASPGQGLEASPGQGHEASPGQGHEASSGQGQQDKHSESPTTDLQEKPSGPPKTGGWAAQRQFWGGLFRNALFNSSNEEETPNAPEQGEPSPGTSAQTQAQENPKKKSVLETMIEEVRELFSIRPRVAPVDIIPVVESPNMTEADREQERNKSPSEQPENNCSSDYDEGDVGSQVPRPEDSEPSPGTTAQTQTQEDPKKKTVLETMIEEVRELFSIRPRVAPVDNIPVGESPNMTEAAMGAPMTEENREQETNEKGPPEQPDSNCSSDYDECDVGSQVPSAEPESYFSSDYDEGDVGGEVPRREDLPHAVWIGQERSEHSPAHRLI